MNEGRDEARNRGRQEERKRVTEEKRKRARKEGERTGGEKKRGNWEERMLINICIYYLCCH